MRVYARVISFLLVMVLIHCMFIYIHVGNIGHLLYYLRTRVANSVQFLTTGVDVQDVDGSTSKMHHFPTSEIDQHRAGHTGTLLQFISAPGRGGARDNAGTGESSHLLGNQLVTLLASQEVQRITCNSTDYWTSVLGLPVEKYFEICNSSGNSNDKILGGIVFRNTSRTSLARNEHVAISDRRVLLINNTNMADYPSPQFLPHLKSPCFVVPDANHTLVLKCIPLAIQIGPPKSGTSQLFSDLSKCHPQIRVDHRMQLDALHNSNLGQYAGGQKSLTKKIIECDQQLRFLLGRQVKPLRDKEIVLPSPLTHSKDCDFMSTEIYVGALHEWEYWNYSPDNVENLGFYTLPRVLHHINPNQLFFGIFRDPVTRTLSDYQYFSYKQPWHEDSPISAREFHDMVEEGISWWYKCVSMYSERRCMFGLTTDGLPQASTEYSLHKRYLWNPNISAAFRLRASMYCLYLKEFLHWFPRQNFLFFRTEDYGSNRIEILNEQLFPFLGIEAGSPEITQCLIAGGSAKNAFHGQRIVPFNETIKMLQKFYRPFNKCFAEMVGDDAFTWGY